MISSSILTSSVVQTGNISVLSGKGLTTISKTLRMTSGELTHGPGGMVIPTNQLDELIEVLVEVKRINDLSMKIEAENKTKK
jgi:hypothetical protein